MALYYKESKQRAASKKYSELNLEPEKALALYRKDIIKKYKLNKKQKKQTEKENKKIEKQKKQTEKENKKIEQKNPLSFFTNILQNKEGQDQEAQGLSVMSAEQKLKLKRKAYREQHKNKNPEKYLQDAKNRAHASQANKKIKQVEPNVQQLPQQENFLHNN